MFRILVIGDIHIGSIKDINYVYNTITDIIEKEVCFNKTNLIVINGDFFNSIFKANSEFISLSINIMSYIVRMCKKTNTKIRMIYGTESHEMNQYRIFNHHLNSDEIDMKIYETVTEEVIDDRRILFIPEEYIDNKNEYYKNYLNKEYDYIFYHGIIIEGMPMLSYNYESKSNEKQVPKFKSKELSNISKICVANHYHIFTDMGDNCYYLGSLFRDSFGEEEPKGYGIIEDDKFIFVENKDAYIYKTYTFDELSDIYNSSDSLIEEIKKIKKENDDIFNGTKVGKIRIIFKLPLTTDNSFKETIRSILNEKLIIPIIKESDINITNEIVDEEDEYEFILDNSLDVIDKIHRFINKQYQIEIEIEKLNKYIKEELNI